ncbi:MAG: hypothetical protein AAGD09_12685 [Cyanobacteria bacterium P01_F01_bin.56]
MTTFPGSPRLIRGGIVLINSGTSEVLRIIALQYNPDNLSRTLQVQGVEGEGGDRSEALRLTGPPIETLSLEAEIDATDQLEFPDRNAATAELGIHPQLAALETLIYPSSNQLLEHDRQARSGTLEIAPMEAPLSLFVWSENRVLPVRLTEFSVTEEAFDAGLNPIRAKVNLGMRVLSVMDLGFDHKGGNLFMINLQRKERLSGRSRPGTLSNLGIGGIP